MKRFLVFFVVISVFSSNLAFGDYSNNLKAKCTTILSTSKAGTIYKQSAPIRSGGVGTPLIGYRKQPTLIFNLNNFSSGWFKIFDRLGNQLASCPYASAHGHRGRARCTNETATMRRKAIANTGSPEVFFLIQSAKKRCVMIKDAGRCEGSVKGLCNQTIK